MLKKIIVFSSLVIGMFFFVGNSSAQQPVAPFKNAEEAYASVKSRGQAKIPSRSLFVQPELRKTDSLIGSATENNPPQLELGPGDTPLFMVHMDRVFVNYDQEVNFSLKAASDYNGYNWTYGVILEPGFSGQYDQDGIIRYFTPNIGSYGSLQSVQSYNTFRNVFSMKMNSSHRDGEYVVMFLTFDGTGVLLQQTINYFYFRNSGPYGRYAWHISKAEIAKRGNTAELVITGNFPRNVPLQVFFGKLDGIYLTYLGSSTDGITIRLPWYGLTLYRDFEMDVIVLDQSMARQSVTLNGAMVIPMTRQ